MKAYSVSTMVPLVHEGIVRGYGEDIEHGVIIAGDDAEAEAKAKALGFEDAVVEEIGSVIG